MQYEINEIIDIFAFYLYLVFTCIYLLYCKLSTGTGDAKNANTKTHFSLKKKSTIEQLGSLLTDIDTGQKQENDKFLVTIIRQYLFTLSMMGFSITRFADI